MAYRKVGMTELKEIFLRIAEGQSKRKVRQVMGIHGTTLNKYLDISKKLGVDIATCTRDVITDSLIESVEQKIGILKGKPEVPPRDRLLLQVKDRIEGYLKKDVPGTKIVKILSREGIEVSQTSFYRFVRAHLGEYAKENITVRLPETKAGIYAQADFGYLGKLWDSATKKMRRAFAFIITLVFSRHMYVYITFSQDAGAVIEGSEAAWAYFGGITKVLIVDNMTPVVDKPDKYAPRINSPFLEYSQYRGFIIDPTNIGHARGKALAEGAIKIIYQRIFAPLRNKIFYSTSELNKEIQDLTDKHNSIPFQKLKISRYELFLEVEKDQLKPIPAEKYEFKRFAYLKVAFNYHIELAEDAHYYSVPYRYIRKKVKVIYTEKSVEIYYNNVRIAFHTRDRKRGGYTTIKDHMPSSHKFYAEWSPDRIIGWAAKIGQDVKEMTVKLLSLRDHPEQAYRASLGIISLAKKYGNKRVNKACARALYYELYKYKAVKNILEKGLNSLEEDNEGSQLLPIHSNIRGADYYNKLLQLDKGEDYGK